MSAVQARIHYALHEELRLLKGIIRDYTPEEYSYEPAQGTRRAKQSDYDQVDVIPVSDPNAATMSQKVVQYQAALQLAQGAPQLYDLPLLHRQMLDVLGIKNYAKLVPMEDDIRPRDPVTENQNILKGKPVKAFFYQDHQAHIMVHQATMQDPKIQSLLANNPQAPALAAAMMAHINEHLGYEYRKQIEQVMGMQIPNTDDEDNDQVIPKEMEIEISRRAAQASQQLLQKNQQEAQQQQAQQQAQDPVIQMQQQELALKAAEQKRKADKDAADIALKQQQLAIEQMRIESQAEIAGAQMTLKHMADKERMDKMQETEGFRQGIAAHMKQRDMQQRDMQQRNQPNKPPKKGE